MILLWKKVVNNNHESVEKTPRPNTLDIVKIDGRWAQSNYNLITFLDDKTIFSINWDDYKLVKEWGGSPVSLVKERENFTEKEISNIYWGPEEKKYPKLKEQVSVFGEFEKNK